MNLTRCQEELESLGFTLRVSNKCIESWSHPDTGLDSVYYYRNPRDKEYFVKLKDFNSEKELRAIEERLEELNEAFIPVHVCSIEHIKTDIQNIYLVKLDCLHYLVVRYPEIPTKTKDCPFCKHPINWEIYSARDWWNEDNDEQS